MTAPNTGSSKQHVANDEIDLRQLFGTLVDGKWWIISATAVCMVFGVVFALLSTPIYRADALIQIEEKNGGVSALTGELGDIFAAEGSAVTEIEVLKSRMVIGRTVNELGLTNQITPSYAPFFGKGLARLTGNMSHAELSSLGVSEELMGRALSLVVTTPNSYQLFHPDGHKLLDGTVGELASADGVAILVSSLTASEGDTFSVKKAHWLDVVSGLQSSLSVSERGKQSGILSLALEGESPMQVQRILDSISRNYESQNIAREAAQAEKSLDFLQEQLPDIRDRLQLAENDLNDYRQLRESVDLTREAQALLDTIVELESRINDLNLQEAEISQRFTEQHPAYKTLIENRRTLLLQREELDARIRELPETQREILSRSRELEVNQEVYTTLLNRVQELTVVKAGTVGFVRILDQAQTALKPVKPKKPLIVVLATMLGGMLGVAFVLVRAFMNPGLTDTTAIEDMGLTVYGNVPFSEDEAKLAKRRQRKGMDPLAIRNPADLAIEAIRSLRTSIHFALMDAPNNVVMITGAAPGAGKSFLSSNLATSLATSEQRVLLIDGDLRRGHLYREFGADKNHGLAEYLQGLNEISDVVAKTKVDQLDVITTGKRPPNPSELLMHTRFRELISWASENYDVVVIDTPPILAVTDAAVVGKLAGVNLLIGRYAEITAKEVDVALTRFDNAGVNINAFILNAVLRTRRSSYGYGYYQYDYQTKDDGKSA
ncbi:MAG: polysaccharide biosynthesis tyrosine autokinase [Gammaproteobacteria bacterium]|nr:polysaccharide biosynthesis tyrosine autokinase [Gammaproteobacteria bacterium]